ncbi:MAG: hypothetical protein MI810_04360 [Flavobacteriales bacterium]|nr:hypothetical protein [Flavobacteriales bacterium]
MKSKQFFFLVIFIGLTASFVGCRKDKRFLNRLENTEWEITTSKRWIIYNDGTTEIFEDLTNAGTIYITEDPLGSEILKEVRMVYTNYLGGTSDFTTLLYTDDLHTRVGMSQVLCNDPFECDLVWTVDVNKRNKQVWSAYGSDGSYFFPPDTYNANKDHHLKWEITLTKVGNL